MGGRDDRLSAVRHEVAQDVHGELGDRVEAGALDDLLQLLVKRPWDLESDLIRSFAFHATATDTPTIASGIANSAAVNIARRVLLLTICLWNLQIPLRT